MREIEFRVWDKKLKKMFQHTDPATISAVIFKSDFLDRYIPMQYVNLIVGGKRLFEGDIVYREICSKDDPARGGGYGDTFVTEWDPLTLDFQLVKFPRTRLDRCPLTYYDSKDLEIIGNIYENPELLNHPPTNEGK